MKKIVIAASAAVLAMSAQNAFAQDASTFTGPRIGVEIGMADDDFLGSEETTWGVNAGYDADLGGFVLGGTVSYTGIFDDEGSDFEELGIGVRAGAKAGDNALVYATVGYSDIDVYGVGVDGVKLGLGIELASSGGFYGQLETRYGSYDYDIDLYQTVVGVGYRF